MEASHENVAPEEIPSSGVVPPAEPTQPQEAASPEGDVSSKEYNWKELRESKKQLERELQELRAEVSRITSPPPAPQEEQSLGDDDLVEGKHLKKVFSQIEKRLSSYQEAQIPDRLRAKFSDFDRVVNAETIEKLKRSEPELFSSLTASSDLYAKGVSAYKAIKRFGIVEDDSYAGEKAQLQRNMAKPGSPSSVQGASPLSQANLYSQRLTPELRKQMYQEMVEAARG